MRYNILIALMNVVTLYLLLPRYAIIGYIIAIYLSRILNFTPESKKARFRNQPVRRPSFHYQVGVLHDRLGEYFPT